MLYKYSPVLVVFRCSADKYTVFTYYWILLKTEVSVYAIVI